MHRRLLFPLVAASLLALPISVHAQSVLLPQYPPGQKTSANSLPVVLPSDMPALPVSVSSLPLPTGAATEATLGGVLTTSAFQARIPVLGQAAMPSSIPVVLASNQTAIPVIQSGAWTVSGTGTFTVESELTLADLDTGGGTDNRAVVGLVFAASGGATLVSAAAGLPVNIVDGSASGTEYTEGQTDATLTGPVLMFETDTGTSAVGAVNATNRLPVTCDNCGGGAGGTSQSDNSALGSITGIGFVYDTTPPAITDGNVGLPRMDSDRIAFVKFNAAQSVTLGAALPAGDNDIGNVDLELAGTAVAAGNPLPVRPSDGSAFQTYAALDLDTGGGTVSRIAIGIAGAASGGPVAIEGTTANGLEVDVTRVQGTVTVDSELPAAVAAADNLTPANSPTVIALNFCRDSAGSNWDMCLSSSLTELAHDAAAPTWTTVVGGVGMLRASATAPANVGASDRPVAPWALLNGSQVVNLAAGGTLITATSSSLNVNVTNSTLAVTQSGTWNVSNISGTISLPTGASTLAEQQTQTTHLAALAASAHSGSDVALGRHSPISAQLDDTSTTTVTENQVAPLRLTSGRALHVAQQGNVTINALPAGTNNIGDVDVLTFPDNEPFNVAQWGGTTVLAGAGNTGTGSPRVTIATDQAALAGMGVGATGSAAPANANYIGGRAGANLRPFTNCDTNAHLRMTTATTTELVAAPGSGRVRFCTLQVFAEGATNITVVRGTGTNCGTGQATIAGPFALTAQTGWNLPTGIGEVMDAGADTAAVCITSSAAVGVTVFGRQTSY